MILVDQSSGLRATLQWVAEVRGLAPECQVVLWANTLAEVDSMRALQAGVRGILKRTIPVDMLLECLRAVAEGNLWVENSISNQVVGFLNRKNTSRLTTREQEIVQLVCRGFKNRQIAQELSITAGTVKVHLMHVFEKTGVKDRYELALRSPKAPDPARPDSPESSGRLPMAELPSMWPLPAPALDGVRRAPAAPACKWWLPSLSDFFFIAVLVWLFAAGSGGWVGLLADADAGWHIRTGEYILDHAAVPKTDLFSYSKPGEPWYAWEWLTDVGMAALHRFRGLPAIVLAAGLLIAATSTLLLSHLFWRGANAFTALPVVLLATGASSIHYLARPHLITLLFVALSMWLLDRDRRAPSPWVWSLIPLAALWTNLHGGFLALLACVALLVVGTAAEALLERDPSRWRLTFRYALLAGACSLATLANPYGVELHLHVAAYLRSDWIREMVQEFQSPSFRNENLLQFELLLFLGVVWWAFCCGAGGWWKRSGFCSGDTRPWDRRAMCPSSPSSPHRWWRAS